jgi:hypothetical protein
MTRQIGTATLSKRYRIGGPDKFAKAHEGPPTQASRLEPPVRLAAANVSAWLVFSPGRPFMDRKITMGCFRIGKKKAPRLGAEVANLVEQKEETNIYILLIIFCSATYSP